jgi:hypothetical protein
MYPWRIGYDLWRLQVEVATISAGAPVVIALRTLRAWQGGGDLADREWTRMVTEKMLAASEAQLRWARLWAKPMLSLADYARFAEAAPGVVRPYGRRVRGNLRRLG